MSCSENQILRISGVRLNGNYDTISCNHRSKVLVFEQSRAWHMRLLALDFRSLSYPGRLAIKIYLSGDEGEESALIRFSRECRVLKQLQGLQGDVVPRVYGYSTDCSSGPQLILQYIRGLSLAEVVEKQETRNIEIIHAIRTEIRRCYDAITKRHVAHCDDRLANVMLVESWRLRINFVLCSSITLAVVIVGVADLRIEPVLSMLFFGLISGFFLITKPSTVRAMIIDFDCAQIIGEVDDDTFVADAQQNEADAQRLCDKLLKSNKLLMEQGCGKGFWKG